MMLRMFPLQQQAGAGGFSYGQSTPQAAYLPAYQTAGWGGPPNIAGVGPQAGVAPTPAQQPPGVVGDISQIAGTAGNLYGLYQSYLLNQAGQQGISQANPFGQYRPYYGAQLMNLMQNPSTVTSLPGYQFLMGQGTEAINRQAAGPGGVGFGSTADKALLAQYGQGLADQFYNQQVQTLSGLAGANITPANAAQMMGATGAAQGSMGAGMQSTIGSAMNLINRFWPQSGAPNYGQTPGGFADPTLQGQSPLMPQYQTPTAAPGDLAGGGGFNLDYSGAQTGDMTTWGTGTADTSGGAVDMSGMFQG